MSNKLKKILIIVSILLVSQMLVLLVGIQYSSDIRGWWPVALFFSTLLYIVYAGFFILIENKKPSSQKYIFILNSILAIILTILGTLYFIMPIDWVAINSGEATLTLFQEIIRNDLTHYAPLVIFLIIHFVFVNFKNKI